MGSTEMKGGVSCESDYAIIDDSHRESNELKQCSRNNLTRVLMVAASLAVVVVVAIVAVMATSAGSAGNKIQQHAVTDLQVPDEVAITPFGANDAPRCSSLLPKSDCGFVGITKGMCEKRGCCWQKDSKAGVPWCFHSNGPYLGYQVVGEEQTKTGMKIDLSLKDGGALFGDDIPMLSVHVDYNDNASVRVRIVDPSNDRWEIPTSILPYPLKPSASGKKNANLHVSYTTYPFGVAVSRKDTGEVVFNSTATGSFNGLVYQDKYIEMTTQLPHDANIYGLGERVHSLRLDPSATYTIWARDAPSPIDQNMYGSHPFYLELRQGKSHGVFMRNSNGMDIAMQQGTSQAGGSLAYRMIGGIVDMTFFAGPTPDAVIEQYTDLIGKPYLPPYWSLGFHQCRWGYKGVEDLQGVVDGYKAHEIPLDTMWTDIDYMDAYKDWTWDPEKFPQDKMKAFADGLHEDNQKYVVIVDPGIFIEDGYEPYEEGVEKGVFIKRPDGTPFTGKVWPGLVHFPDWFHPEATSYWKKWISFFLDTVPVDGLWIDMNEASNFCSGDCSGSNDAVPNDKTDSYHINNSGNHSPLNTKAIDVDATHYGGVSEYDVHNLYGFMESIATKEALEEIRQERSLVITRSTFAGSGTHVGHWLGDNFSTFSSLSYSIPGILAMNMLGIPLVGADICGFSGSTTEELCARWMAVGAFYPFSRNHNANTGISQEPYLWDSVSKVSQKVLRARYSILPYYYTLFQQSHQSGRGVVRPLFFQYPDNADTIMIDHQFLIGDAIMVSPVITQGATTVDVYFASEDLWYDFWSGDVEARVGWTTVDAPIDHIPIHWRGGTVVLTQEPALTTTESRKNPYTLVVAPNADGIAVGEAILDDGVTLGETSQIKISYSLNGHTVSAAAKATKVDDESNTEWMGVEYSTVAILGQHSCQVKSAEVNKQTIGTSGIHQESNGRVTFSLPSGISADSSWKLSWTCQ